MRKSVAEKFADAFMMTIHRETKGVAGGKTVMLDFGDGCQMPFQVQVIDSFAAPLDNGGDAALLLQMPGNLRGFLGYEASTRRLVFVLFDATKLKNRKPKEFVKTSYVKVALLRFGIGADTAEGDNYSAVVGSWQRGEGSHDDWKALV